jgi:hypothetical protein
VALRDERVGVAALLRIHGVEAEVVHLCGAPHKSTNGKSAVT